MVNRDEEESMTRRRSNWSLLLASMLGLAMLLPASAAARQAAHTSWWCATHANKHSVKCPNRNSRRHPARVRTAPRQRSRATRVAPRLVVGLDAGTAGWGGASTAGRLDQVTTQTGAKWLREEFLWSTIEPQPGTFDFSYYDHYMLLAAGRGLHVLPVLDGTPSWAGANWNTIPADPTAYAQFVAAVVGRYGSGGSFWLQNPSLKSSAIGTWELWNEPYYASNYDPAAYAELVKAAGSAGHAADPSAKFLLGAEMQSARNANGDWVWWVDALYQAVPDLNNYFDGVAIHPYGSDTTTLNPIIPGQPYANYGHVRRAEDIHQQFINHGANKPFWITEAGASSCTQTSIDCVTEAGQAAYLTTLFGYVHNSWSTWVQAAFIYRYQDGANPSTVQDGYGLTHLDGTAKPALSVFKTQAATSA
jgi:hypothetical protein